MTNSTDAWDEYTYQTPVFRFAYHQFLSLKKVNIALSILSVVGSALIIVAFLYLFFRERKRTNRISLRCVFFCAIADTLNAMLDIVIINYRGNTEICRTSGVIIIFTKIISAALLAIVGINFVLIFVLNIKQRDRLEYYYYAGTLVYSTVTLIFPIIAAVRNDNPTQLDNFTCWYLVYINDRTHNYWSWMWFYGLLFVIIVIAALCSLSAMYKLAMEQHRISQKIKTLREPVASEPSPNRLALEKEEQPLSLDEEDQQMSRRVEKRHSTTFTKVVLRCIVYPLVPVIVNILGFITQMVISMPKANPSYVLAMLDIVFSNLEGFLTAIVFFTDPAIRTYMTEELNDWRSQYFNKYSRIETYEEGQGIRFSLTEGASSLVSAKSTKKQGHAPVSCKHHFIAMYRMNIPSASYSRLCRNPKHLVISTASCDDGWSKTVICHMRTKECNRTFCFSDDITDEIYIPYRFPRLVHFVRSACKCLRLAPSKPIEPSTPISYYAQTKSFDDNSWTVSSNNSCESRHPSEL